MSGRPSKLTSEVQASIVGAIEQGNFAEVAAALAGIHRDTFYSWMDRGKRGEAPYSDFSDARATTTRSAPRHRRRPRSDGAPPPHRQALAS